MELKVTLPSPNLVIPSAGPSKQVAFDAPPTYDAASSSAGSPSSRVFPSPLSLSSSSSTTSSSTLLAVITLTAPSTLQITHVLTSLTAKLVASESLAHNNGGFEQSRPLHLRVSIPLPSQNVFLHPGKGYAFHAELRLPDDAPPSVQLPDARVRYRLEVRAKTLPASARHSWWTSLMREKRVSGSCDLTVMQAVDVDGDECYSDLKRVQVDGLGSACISTARSCVIGASTSLDLSLPDDPNSIGRVSNVELALRQDSFIRSRAAKSTPKQHKKPLLVELPPTHTSDSHSKSNLRTNDTYQAHFHIPPSPDLQPSTLPGSRSVIHVSHHLRLTIEYLDDAAQPRSYAFAWPVTVAHSDAIYSTLSDQLPVYTPPHSPLP